jgi:tRNA threonylcarbamoyladenosine biosynthesis protein TsaE
MATPTVQNFQWSNKSEAEKWAHAFAASLKRPTMILLNGEMGAGKTQLVRWILSTFAINGVASPTFAIHHQYASKTGPIDHFDLYRLSSLDDLESTGFWDLICEPQSLVFIEWSNRLDRDAWPKDRPVIQIDLVKGSGESRTATVTCFNR